MFFSNFVTLKKSTNFENHSYPNDLKNVNENY